MECRDASFFTRTPGTTEPSYVKLPRYEELLLYVEKSLYEDMGLYDQMMRYGKMLLYGVTTILQELSAYGGKTLTDKDFWAYSSHMWMMSCGAVTQAMTRKVSTDRLVAS